MNGINRYGFQHLTTIGAGEGESYPRTGECFECKATGRVELYLDSCQGRRRVALCGPCATAWRAYRFEFANRRAS